MSNAHYWNRKEELAEKAQKHTKEMKEKYANEINEAIKNSIIWSRERGTTELIKEVNGEKSSIDTRTINYINKPTTSFKVSKMTTQEALFNSLEEHITILNFASYKNPGGMFINGSSAQEESLCHSSFLFNVLKELMDYYNWNREHLSNGLYTDRAIYTPNVTFIDEKGYEVVADVITCAAPNRSLLVKYNAFTEDENVQVLASRVKFVRDVAYLSNPNTKELILGAWGCGVFQQDAKLVAQFMLESFANSDYNFVTFAIPDDKNLERFNKAF